MDKIKMTTPIVEMDGDEMTRILWQHDQGRTADLPFVELNTEYYDLGLPHRDDTQRSGHGRRRQRHQKASASASSAPPSRRTSSAWRNTSSHEMWKSPNGTIRAILDGTVFRTPILIGMHPART